MDISGGNVPFLEVGGRRFTDLTNLKVLGAYAGTTHRASFTTEAGQNYAPATGKKFVVWAVEVMASAANQYAQIAYSDNALPMDSATAFTNGKYAFDNPSAANCLGNLTFTKQAYPFFFQVPAGKYVGFYNAGSGDVFVRIYGYEVNV